MISIHKVKHLTPREAELVAMTIRETLEQTRAHLLEVSPERTQTARRIITTGLLEAEQCWTA